MIVLQSCVFQHRFQRYRVWLERLLSCNLHRLLKLVNLKGGSVHLVHLQIKKLKMETIFWIENDEHSKRTSRGEHAGQV